MFLPSRERGGPLGHRNAALTLFTEEGIYGEYSIAGKLGASFVSCGVFVPLMEGR